MPTVFNVVPPGGTLGILGGGHLGRMTAVAARALGYRTHVLEIVLGKHAHAPSGTYSEIVSRA